ncbi:putative bifunctional diguanylate cyclase/phosphodiesterase [Thaumasiovibrio sp. DFM-14]|uniref:putative bifunctional diguanylate cyclase/phosphodiesterase n=1 Tax=Thaumasiovibrio sp. DFM-14 TaxID=3384792 RepID=UPI00399F7F1C
MSLITSLSSRLHTPIWIFNLQQRSIAWANNAALKLWEAETLTELTNRNLGTDMSLAVSATLDFFNQKFQQGESIKTWWHITPKQQSKKVLCHFSGLRLDNDEHAMLVEVIAEEEGIQRALAFSEHSNNALLFDHAGKLISANTSFKKYYAPTFATLAEFTGSQALAMSWLKKVKSTSVLRTVHHCHSGGKRFWFNLEMRWLKTEQQLLIHLINIDAEKQSQFQAQYESDHDFLTKLLNRKGLEGHLLNSNDPQPCILFIDIDGFKLVNDTYGHLVGDQLLFAIAVRLQGLLPDNAKLARFGGDEFIVYLPNNDAESISDRIINQCNTPFDLAQVGRLSIGCSIGIAKSTSETKSLDQLVKNADIAMLKAKKAGRNRTMVFSPSMLEEIRRKSLLRQQLCKALEENNFHLNLQPIFCTETAQIHSAEVLLRWQDPALGWVSPAEFIPIAEETGQMQALGLWVIETTCKLIAHWQNNNRTIIPLHINLSQTQLNPKLAEQILHLVDFYSINRDYLAFEITESAVSQQQAQANQCLIMLSQAGFSLQLDDFGTGHSALSMLDRLPVNTVKLDRSFISSNTKCANAVLKATLMICNECNLTMVAEGIETKQQFEYVRKLNIPYCQGYFLAKPMTLSEFQCHYLP